MSRESGFFNSKIKAHINYQTIDKKILDDAKNRLQSCSNIMYYAWPQQFASTSGPFGGVGGCTISVFTIEAIFNGKDAAIYCKGRFVIIIKNFDIIKAVSCLYRF